MATAAKLIDLARQELGTAEFPRGSNRVKYNTAYYGKEVSGDAYPWCCVFVWWLFREAGCPELFFGGMRTASCNALADWVRRQGRFFRENCRAGDVVFLGFDGGGICHMGIVEQVRPDGTLVTIEGNTGSVDDANGGEVQRRLRPPAYFRGVYRPLYEEETVTQEQFDAMMANWLERRAGEAPANFSEEARAWAESAGLILGDDTGRKQYKSFCTREQMMVFLHRLQAMLRGGGH